MLNTPFVSQDTLGGGFDATQAFVGELANLNIWNRKLSITEIYNLATCNSKASTGDVFSWTESNIEVFGGATKWTFEPCRSANWTASHRWRKAYLYFWAFVVLVFIWRLLETIWVIGKLKSGISTILRYPCCKTTLFILRKKKNLFHLGNLSEKVLLLSFFFLGHSVESTSKLFVWLISSWTGSWQSAPYVWTIHNPSEELHNHSLPPLPSGEWEITLSVQFLSVFGAVKWCLMRYSSPWPLPSSHASPPPSLLLHFAPPLRNLHCDWWRGMPGEEGTLKDTAKSNCGTSRFVIIVRFKCFCKNVVNLPTLLEAWVPWAGTNIQHIRYVFSCKFNVYWFLFFFFPLWAGLSFLFFW